MSHAAERLGRVRSALVGLGSAPLVDELRTLLRDLGYASPKTLDTGGAPDALLVAVGVEPARFDPFGGVQCWRSLEVAFQLTGDELPALARGSAPSTSGEYRVRDIDSFVFLALDLAERAWTRRELVGITRELNRGFAMPAIIAFRHGKQLTLSVIDRHPNRRDTSRDVVGGRVSLIKDIDFAHPHRAHLEILADLTLSSLRPAPTDFRALYDRWLDVLSAAELNKRFYRDLADWFAWASSKDPDTDEPRVVRFPSGQGNQKGDVEIGLIRLLTRLMFVWFVKQKDLVPAAFFDRDKLSALLANPPHDDPDGHGYYLAVLQNLFFACLNTEMDERGWLPRTGGGSTPAYLDHSKLRQRALFADADAALAEFQQVPFLNGGLFDCLDVEVKAGDPRWERATQEVRATADRRVLRVDGFSEMAERQPTLPNRLFFDGQPNADLSGYYGKPTRRDVTGLIDLFERYKFTVEENTPLEEEAALDPELLGKVFENLLASYNEDTRTTARNKSGSFYTPREVVDFMVDEALVAYLTPVLAPTPTTGLRPRTPSLDFGPAAGELTLERPPVSATQSNGEAPGETRLRALLSWSAEMPAFTDAEADALVAAIEQCRAIDPAVGSGAFPLGLLQKLVHVLSRLDPGGAKWKAANRAPFLNAIENAKDIKSPADRAQEVARAEERLAAFDAAWPEGSHAEYARKLYLIEGCLHGVDIQPIAVQIAKLRCFISLAVEQDVAPADAGVPNRGVLALPNLELKFVAANALGFLADGQPMLRGDETRGLLQQRSEAGRSFFSARSRGTKRAARERILELRSRLAESLRKDGYGAGDADAVAAWNPFDANAAARFFDPVLMFGLDEKTWTGFDVVLANPPYVRQEKIESYRLFDGTIANKKSTLAANYATAAGTADLLVYFFERAVRLLKPGGAVAFITSNKWYRAAYGAKLRSWLSAETRLRTVIDFGDAEVFEAIAYPTIVVAQKRLTRHAPEASETFRALNWTTGEAPDGFPAKFDAESFILSQAELSGDPDWQILPPRIRSIIKRLRLTGRPLAKFLTSEINRGITTGFNDAFEIDGSVRALLIQDASAELVKPLLRGRTLRRWKNESPESWIIFARRGVNIDSYPAARAHLSKFRSKLEPKPKGHSGMREGRKPGGYKWWELQDNVAYWPVFEAPKIISNKVSDYPNFSYDMEGYYIANTSYCFNCKSDKLVLGVLNSTISNFLSRRIFVDKEGGFYEVQPDALASFPIPEFTSEQETLITLVVDAILAGAQPRAPLEALLNAFVYELFFPEEVAAAGSPFAAAREAGLLAVAALTGPALARAAEGWFRTLADPASPLYRSLFALQSLEPVRIIEGRT